MVKGPHDAVEVGGEPLGDRAQREARTRKLRDVLLEVESIAQGCRHDGPRNLDEADLGVKDPHRRRRQNALSSKLERKWRGTKGYTMQKRADLHSISEVARRFGVSVATLRFYEDERLVTPSERVSRVRHYDREALCTLAYALLWHRDAQLSLHDTRELMRARTSRDRHALIGRQLDSIAERIARLENAQATLEHLLDCPSDNPMTCPRTGATLHSIVDEALGRC
jgi:DNA-binding transcriptional MerR regulator